MADDAGPQAARARQKLIDKVLGDPDLYSDEFKSWVPRWVNDSVLLKIQNFQLPSVDNTHYVGTGSGAPDFAGAWVNYGVGYETAGYYRDPWGHVFLTGSVKDGASGTTIYSLPGSYRPKNRERFVVDTDTGIGRIDVAGTGEVIHVSGGTGFVSLSGINFRAFQ